MDSTQEQIAALKERIDSMPESERVALLKEMHELLLDLEKRIQEAPEKQR